MIISTPKAHAVLRDRGLVVSISVVAGLICLLVLGVFHRGGSMTNFVGSGVLSSQQTGALIADGLETIIGPQRAAEEDGFTLVVLTFRRRESLPTFIQSYAKGNIKSLRRIVVVWNDVEAEPNAKLLRNLTSHPVPVVIEQSRVNSLNERFRRSKNIKTDCVLSMDDDVSFAPSDLEFGYQVWKEFGQGRRRMVGFDARRSAESHTKYDNGGTDYSMVLTKTAFYHRDWMDMYWSKDETMTNLRDYVDKHKNCEDILMAFLHAHHTRTPPIFIKAPKQDFGEHKGISGGIGHMQGRSECIRIFSGVFGNETLVSSSIMIKNMQSPGGENNEW